MPRAASSDDRRDPLIALRIPAALNERLRAEATNTGSTLSEIVRHAIEHRLQDGTTRAAAKPQRKAAMCEHRVRVGNYCRRCDGVV